jgi:bile acid-coenzyme A ligase
MPLSSYGRAMSWLAERDPQGLALVHDERRVTRAGLERRANRLARAYAERGVREGDLVTLALANGC